MSLSRIRSVSQDTPTGRLAASHLFKDLPGASQIDANSASVSLLSRLMDQRLLKEADPKQ